MEYLAVPNWDKFQHYSSRSPTWIKLHLSLLSKYDWTRLPPSAQALLVGIWLLTAQRGKWCPMDVQWVGQRCGNSHAKYLQRNVDLLIRRGFLALSASSVLAQSQRESKSREEKTPLPPKGELSLVPVPRKTPTKRKPKQQIEYPQDFLAFWDLYPRKVSKGDALKAWGQILEPRPTQETLAGAVETTRHSPRWLKDGGEYIPYPASWLRARCWEDEPENWRAYDGKPV